MDNLFQFNAIYIIESLSDDETQTGKELYDDIVSRRAAQTDLFYTKLLSVNDKNEFKHSLVTINDYAKKRYHPFIHFEIHGSENKDGLILKSGEFIPWSEFADLTREINITTKNNLVISLATCYGAYFNKEIRILKPAPFCGSVSAVALLYSDEILIRFTIFFETLFTSRDFDEAMTRLNEAEDLGYKFRFITAIELFEDLCNDMLQGRFNENDISFRNWVNELTRKLISTSLHYANMKKKDVKQIVRQQILGKKNTYMTDLKKTFLLQET